MNRYAQQFNVEVRGVSQEVMGIFATYSWPGNVRELQHAIEAAVQLLQGAFIGIEHLPPHIAAGNAAGPWRSVRPRRACRGRRGRQRGASGGRCGLVATLDRVETNMIRRA